MYLRRIPCGDRRWVLLQPSKYLFGPKFCFHSLSPVKEHDSITRRHLLGSDSSRQSFSGLGQRCSVSLKSAYSDGRNASENKQGNAHARLGEQDQEEWLSIQSKRRESPLLTRRDKFRNEFLRRIVPWEKINVSWDTFPYHIHEHTKTYLKEFASSHLRHHKFASSFGTRLGSSSGRILLQSIYDTELYRERLVKALAQDLQVPLLVLDSCIFAPYDIDYDDDLPSEYESHDHSSESCWEENNDYYAISKDWASSTYAKDSSYNLYCGDEVARADACLERLKAAVQELVPYNVEELAKTMSGKLEISEPSKSHDDKSDDKIGCQLRKGDRVKYTGPSIPVMADNSRPLANGQRGEVYEVNGDQVSVILDINEVEMESVNKRKPPIYCINVNNIEHDLDAPSQDCYIAMEALCEVLHSKQPLIVYFPDNLHKSVPMSIRKEFIGKLQEMFDQLSGPLVLICGQNIREGKNHVTIYPSLSDLPFSPTKTSEDCVAKKPFIVLSIQPPKDENLLATFKAQLGEDKKFLISRCNLNNLRNVLEENQLSCADLLHADTHGVILTTQKAEKVVDLAKNHYLSSCLHPRVKGDRLCLPRESLEIAISRVKGVEAMSKKDGKQ